MPRPLPPTIAAGYANWGECDAKMSRAAVQGVNLLIWFAIQLVVDKGRPSIIGGPNLTCVATLAADLRARNLSTHHFISIGGWNAPHPTAAGGTSAEWWAALAQYDRKAAEAGLPGGFDGIDWDLEGNDDVQSQWNTFPAEDLRLVAALSVRAKRAGKLVSLVPPQSYLDVTSSTFSLSVAQPARCWHPEFTYAGRSVYAALLALAPPGTYDLVSLQLYESWSLAACAIYHKQRDPADYLRDLVAAMDRGWTVDFEEEPSLGLRNTTVRVPAATLLLGVANGWTKPSPTSKALFLPPSDLARAWAAMRHAKSAARGVVFWDIADEGAHDPPLYMAAELNAFLHTRDAPQADSSRAAPPLVETATKFFSDVSV